MEYIRFAEGVRGGKTGGGMMGSEDWKSESRQLTRQEQAVYDAALKTLLDYFNEPGVEGAPGRKNPPDDPKIPERQNA